jgi:hypothetical protein
MDLIFSSNPFVDLVHLLPPIQNGVQYVLPVVKKRQITFLKIEDVTNFSITEISGMSILVDGNITRAMIDG